MTDPAPITPAAAVVIPHYNDVVRLDRCLAALTKDPLPAPTEIVVVDNGSTQDLSRTCAAHPDITFLTETQRGAAAARNAGVAQTTAPRIFFLDCDCVPSPDWIKTAYDLIEGRDIVGGAVEVFDETAPPRNGAQVFETVFAFNQERYIAEMNFSVTANLLTWRRIWDDVGPLIPGLSEDRDWCNRAVAKGYRLTYEPRLCVAHPTRNDWAALRKKWLRLTEESYALTAQQSFRRPVWAVRAVLVLMSSLAHAPKILTSPKLGSTTERLRGLSTLFRLRAARMVWMMRQVFSTPLPSP
ncbi:glycosyltransferase [uncultured Tateyamaria sp.]|uniref:glycosyltransferase family 2 protein n=1 Tax=uncultured Tateyamaria sp. TaxID=455651 RepID=UPI00262B9DFE|nr:glycosyltransferase [uncultured Tateyamaria sp.]